MYRLIEEKHIYIYIGQAGTVKNTAVFNKQHQSVTWNSSGKKKPVANTWSRLHICYKLNHTKTTIH